MTFSTERTYRHCAVYRPSSSSWWAEVYRGDAPLPIWSRPRFTYRGAQWAAFWAARRLRKYDRKGLLP